MGKKTLKGHHIDAFMCGSSSTVLSFGMVSSYILKSFYPYLLASNNLSILHPKSDENRTEK